MALNQSALLELTEVLRSADEGQLMRSLLHTILQALIDAEAQAHIGAGLHERSDGRLTQRNGTRAKMVSTAAGDLAVKIPKTRTGSFFPSLLHPRRRIDVALHAVVMEAYVHGVSTRKVDDLVSALGAETGISKSEVSRICGELDTEVAAFNGRDLAGQGFRTCSSTPPTARPGSVGTSLARGLGCARRRWSSPPGSAPMGAGRCWAARSGIPRPRRFGRSSCAACGNVAWPGCSWSSLIITAG